MMLTSFPLNCSGLPAIELVESFGMGSEIDAFTALQQRQWMPHSWPMQKSL